MSGEDIRCELRELRKKRGGKADKGALIAKYTNAIALLPSFEAQILRAYYIEHKTHEQIAAEIFYSPDTVRRILKRGILMLSAKMK